MLDERLLNKGYIGSDESGKGDYFGPLVIAAIATGPGEISRLEKWGVRDSKQLSDKKIAELSELIRDNLDFEVIAIGPEKYNSLYNNIGNLNKLMAWAHARAIENLAGRVPGIKTVIVDKFGPEYRLRSALMNKGRELEIVQIEKAEKYPGVAAASIIAREEFTRRLSALLEEIGVSLPRGATHVLDTARAVYDKGGTDLLSRVAKLHFKTTENVVRP